MNIDANNILQLNAVNKVSNEQQPIVPQHQDPVKKVVNKDDVNQVSVASHNLQTAYDSLSDKSDVDLEKVSLIQKALAEDKLVLENKQLVAAMLETHKSVLELFKR